MNAHPRPGSRKIKQNSANVVHPPFRTSVWLESGVRSTLCEKLLPRKGFVASTPQIFSFARMPLVGSVIIPYLPFKIRRMSKGLSATVIFLNVEHFDQPVWWAGGQWCPKMIEFDIMLHIYDETNRKNEDARKRAKVQHTTRSECPEFILPSTWIWF